MKNRKKFANAGRLLGSALLVSLALAGMSEWGQIQISSEAATGNREKKTASLSELSAIDSLCSPNGITALSDGTIMVTDTYQKCLWRIREDTAQAASGDTMNLYGESVGLSSAVGPSFSYFRRPWDVVEVSDGWAVSDADGGAVFIVKSKQVTTSGKTEELLSVSDKKMGFQRPTGLATDTEGNLYVSDTESGTVHKITPQGDMTTEAQGLSEPMGLFWKDGTLYVAESGANRIIKVKDGQVQAVAGNGEEGLADGPAAQAAFAAPRDVVVGDDGTIYVADTLNSSIRRIQNGQVDTVTARDMMQTQFGLVSPTGLLLQGGRLFICDNFSKKIFVLEWK